ncbi:unnamed protein product, partial [Durusdinium trenchii]
GTVAYQLPPGEYPYAPLAKSGPAVGDPVYSWGYPGDSGASFSQGVITGVAIAGGYEPSSMGEVTVYTASYCGWCQSLKQHYDQGVFKPYQFRFIDVGDAPPAGVESLPTVEFHGRRVSGYDPSNPAGLLRWLNSVARSPVKSTGAKVQLYRASVMATPGWSGGPLFDAAGSVVGLCSVSNLENSTGWIRLEDLSSVYTASISRRGPIPFSRPEGARSPADDVATLKAQLASLVKDIEEFKSAGILGKLGEIGDLKRDFAGLKASAAAARDEADKAKAEIDRLRGEGWPWWYALPFSIGGVIHRFYLMKRTLSYLCLSLLCLCCLLWGACLAGDAPPGVAVIPLAVSCVCFAVLLHGIDDWADTIHETREQLDDTRGELAECRDDLRCNREHIEYLDSQLRQFTHDEDGNEIDYIEPDFVQPFVDPNGYSGLAHCYYDYAEACEDACEDGCEDCLEEFSDEFTEDALAQHYEDLKS